MIEIIEREKRFGQTVSLYRKEGGEVVHRKGVDKKPQHKGLGACLGPLFERRIE
jgi:hypothetical protein